MNDIRGALEEAYKDQQQSLDLEDNSVLAEEAKNDDAIDSEKTEAVESTDIVDKKPEEVSATEDEKAVIPEKEATDDETKALKEDGISAPEHWTATDKQAFDNLSADQKDWVLQKEKSWESRSTSKFEEAANIRKQYEPIDNVLKPLEPIMHQNGLSKEQTIAMWAQTQQALLDNPAEAISQLQEMYGINPSSGDGEDQDPKLLSVQSELNQIKQSLQEREQADITRQKEKNYNMLSEFIQSKDESGNLKHPYAEEAMPVMVEVMKMKKAQGLDPSLSEVYDAAIYMEPSLREKIIKQAQSAEFDNKKAQQEAQKRADQEKADKAKQASRTLTGSNGSSLSVAAASTGNIREDLENAMKSQQGRI